MTRIPAGVETRGLQHLARDTLIVRMASLVGGVAAGLIASPFGLAVPWALAAILATTGIAAKRLPRFVWPALGVVIGAISYLVLGWAVEPFQAPGSLSGGG
ncbi:MAG: hypothetical protein LBO20_09420 [Bifidobacteriaceae bacterium]|jgi:hypothetical protein|nr:hypothetical protein [Bifidobacteriaceae bacterium]